MSCENGVCRMDAGPPLSDDRHFAVGDSALSALFGVDLLDKGEGSVKLESIEGAGKVVALYFSASWCGPCQNFTPKLAAMYNTFKATHANALDFDVVFVSSDRDEASFKGYYQKMPWLALPFSQRATKTVLSKKYKVQGIPSLVLLDAQTGEVINGDADSELMGNPTGFPWRPKTFAQLLDCSLTNKNGALVPASTTLEGKVKMIYFSALWCPPCKRFTPELAAMHTLLKEQGRNFETVFVSGDKTLEEFKGYLSEMPFLALPFEERSKKQQLNSLFKVNGIPSLVILDEKDNVITLNGRAAVSADPQGVNFPWHPAPLSEIGDDVGDIINDAPVVLLLLGGRDEVAGKAKAEKLLAEKAKAVRSRVPLPSLRFLWAMRTSEVVPSLIEFAQLVTSSEEEDILAVLHVPEEQQVYRYNGVGELTSQNVSAFVDAYFAGKLSGVGL